MIKHCTSLALTVCAAFTLCGCGEAPKATPPSTDSTTAAAAPATPAVPAVPATPTAPAPEAAQPVTTAAGDISAQLLKATAAQPDKVLSSLATELTSKARSFAASLSSNPTVKSQVDSVLQSLTGGKDSEALSGVFQVVEAAKLTPAQISLAKEVGNVTSAFVVQRNFASLEGAQGDVATIVNSLRKGEVTAAAPAIQRVVQNTGLTPSQKQLMTSVAEKYAPGLKQAADKLQQGLQAIPGLK